MIVDRMENGYISSDEEDVYMRSQSAEEEITDIRDLRLDLERFQQVFVHGKVEK